MTTVKAINFIDKHELLHVSKKQVFEQLRFPHLSLIKIGTVNYDELLNYESW